MLWGKSFRIQERLKTQSGEESFSSGRLAVQNPYSIAASVWEYSYDSYVHTYVYAHCISYNMYTVSRIQLYFFKIFMLKWAYCTHIVFHIRTYIHTQCHESNCTFLKFACWSEPIPTLLQRGCFHVANWFWIRFSFQITDWPCFALCFCCCQNSTRTCFIERILLWACVHFQCVRFSNRLINYVQHHPW